MHPTPRILLPLLLAVLPGLGLQADEKAEWANYTGGTYRMVFQPRAETRGKLTFGSGISWSKATTAADPAATQVLAAAAWSTTVATSSDIWFRVVDTKGEWVEFHLHNPGFGGGKASMEPTGTSGQVDPREGRAATASWRTDFTNALQKPIVAGLQLNQATWPIDPKILANTPEGQIARGRLGTGDLKNRSGQDWLMSGIGFQDRYADYTWGVKVEVLGQAGNVLGTIAKPGDSVRIPPGDYGLKFWMTAGQDVEKGYGQFELKDPATGEVVRRIVTLNRGYGFRLRLSDNLDRPDTSGRVDGYGVGGETWHLTIQPRK